jgi:hypothetical protein
MIPVLGWASAKAYRISTITSEDDMTVMSTEAYIQEMIHEDQGVRGN